jgi:uncharacterized membrane protein YjgN (DUF898 family)
MKKAILAALALGIVTLGIYSAHAGQCFTNCQRFGNQTNCTQTCY